MLQYLVDRNSTSTKAKKRTADELKGFFSQVPSVESEQLEQFARNLHSLTFRELEVFAFLVFGYSNKEIARALCISPRTVEVHRARAIETIGCKNTVSAARLFAAYQAFCEYHRNQPTFATIERPEIGDN